MMQVHSFDSHGLQQALQVELQNPEGSYVLFRLRDGDRNPNLLLTQFLSNIQKDDKYIIVEMNLNKEIGWPVNLLKLEIKLIKAIKKVFNLSRIHLIPRLRGSLLKRLHPQKPEIIGPRTHPNELPGMLLATLKDISSELNEQQRIVILLRAGSDIVFEEAFKYLQPLLNLLPDRIKFLITVTEFQSLTKIPKLHLHSDLDYYWDNPKHLSFNILNFQQAKSIELINYLTLVETITLLRLWGMVDVATSAIETALDLLPNYDPHVISLSNISPSSQVVMPLGFRDHYEAEYHLCREYAYYLCLSGDVLSASTFFLRAIKSIDRSESVSHTGRIVAKIQLWGDKAQAERENGELSKAIDALKQQKLLCEKLDSARRYDYLSMILNNLGVIYQELGNFNKALKSLHLLIELEQNRHNTVGELQASLEIGRVYLTIEDYSKAIDTFNRILEMTKTSSHHNYTKGIALGYLGAIFKEIGQMDQAYNHIQEALRIFQALGSPEDIEMAEKILSSIVILTEGIN